MLAENENIRPKTSLEITDPMVVISVPDSTFDCMKVLFWSVQSVYVDKVQLLSIKQDLTLFRSYKLNIQNRTVA